VATAVAAANREAAARLLIERGLPCLGALPEDRALASPTLDEVARALDAEYLVAASDPDEVIDHFMIGSIASDPGQRYFACLERKAVITRFDKTDLLLAALNTPLACLILTGGRQPSPYVLDRVRTEKAAVLLTSSDTVSAMPTLEELFGATRFRGWRKIERIGALLEEFLELPALLSRLD
jgi:BioD-like phosphotransacetylase family protein